ncbi:MAG: response regulator transcription factor, partial [Spirochaetota bacterium]
MTLEAKIKKILLVDDEVKLLEVVKAYLVRAGYAVTTAQSGKEALKKFELENFSLIILDLMLPDISGEEVCKYIRKKSRVPVIMLTAKSDESAVLEGFQVGADDYVTKPFSPKELLARVAVVLRRTGLLPLSDKLEFNQGDLSVDIGYREVKKKGGPVNLTPQEFRL